MEVYGPAGSFLNFNSSNGTLTGGKYTVSGTLNLATSNSGQNNIVMNQATITLNGATAKITTQNNQNALATLATNGSKGSFTVEGGQLFTTSGSFSNSGRLVIGAGSTLTVGGSGSYIQNGGSTTIDGVLTTSALSSFIGGSYFQLGAGSVLFNNGKVFGNGGNIAASVQSKASLTPSDAPSKLGSLTISGAYTQESKGALNVLLDGRATGKFDQLNVTGAASLAGTLNITLHKGFVPKIGATFPILTAASVTGTFSTVNGTSINGSEHFVVQYNAANVTLQVVAGAM